MATHAQVLSREIAHPCLTRTNTRTNRLSTLPCQHSALRFTLHAPATPAHSPTSCPCPLRTKEFTFFAHFPELFDLFFEVFPRFFQNSRVFHVFHTLFRLPKPPTYPTLPPPAPLSRFTRQQALAPTTSGENALQISPFYAKQTQSPEHLNKRKLMYNR